MALLDRLQRASFKGIQFLVENSSITFGQKTVVHQFPNADRTEVEFLGVAEDTFTLEMFIHSTENDYIELRNALKQSLSDTEPGLLVHPYEGQIRCSVVGQATLVENDTSLGIARFSVTFQKTTEKLFPSQAQDNSTVIRQLFLDYKTQLNEFVEDNFSFIGTYTGVFTSAESRLNELVGVMNGVRSLVPLNASRASNYLSRVRNFATSIPEMILNSSLLSTNLDSVFSSMQVLASEKKDDITIYRSFFDYTDSLPDITPITVEGERIENNDSVLKQYVQALSLALAYNAISIIDFNDDVEMDFFQDTLEAQYQKIITFSDSDNKKDLSLLRNEATLYFQDQAIRRVLTIDIAPMPLVKLTYLLYENLDDFQRLFELNGRRDPTLYRGDTRVLTVE